MEHVIHLYVQLKTASVSASLHYSRTPPCLLQRCDTLKKRESVIVTDRLTVFTHLRTVGDGAFMVVNRCYRCVCMNSSHLPEPAAVLQTKATSCKRLFSIRVWVSVSIRVRSGSGTGSGLGLGLVRDRDRDRSSLVRVRIRIWVWSGSGQGSFL